MSMNNYILAGASFLVGAAISGIATWMVAKKRYEKIHQDAMDAVWNDIKGVNKEAKTETKTPDEALEHNNPIVNKPDLFEYAAKIQQEGYESSDDLPKTNDNIYEIGPMDLDEDRYKRIDLTYYEDGVLADDYDYPIRDLADTVGENFAELFKGRDEIFVRNEKHRIDYDIVVSQLTYGEMLDRHPETQQRLDYADAMDNYYEDSDSDEEEDEDNE